MTELPKVALRCLPVSEYFGEWLRKSYVTWRFGELSNAMKDLLLDLLWCLVVGEDAFSVVGVVEAGMQNGE